MASLTTPTGSPRDNFQLVAEPIDGIGLCYPWTLDPEPFTAAFKDCDSAVYFRCGPSMDPWCWLLDECSFEVESLLSTMLGHFPSCSGQRSRSRAEGGVMFQKQVHRSFPVQ